MNVSTRGKEAQASPIRRLAPYAEAAMKEGATVYQLNIGQPDLPTPDIVMERIRERKAIAGTRLSAEEILGHRDADRR